VTAVHQGFSKVDQFVMLRYTEASPLSLERPFGVPQGDRDK